MNTIIILLFCLLSAFKVDAFDCKDENNNPVDWFVVYKLPQLHDYGTVVGEGYGYLYITSDENESWTHSKLSIGDENSIIGNTLREFYHQNRTNLSYVLYNDETPNGTQSSKQGHTKGVVIADTKGGIWLVHSVPKFPNEGDSYFYPNNARRFGQSFICISMDLNNINTVGTQLQYNQPFIYFEHIAQGMQSQIPELTKAAANETVSSPPWSNVAQIHSKNNVVFTSFAKHGHFNQDLYAGLVAPTLKTEIDVETWPNGAGRLPSNCSGNYKVYDVKTIKMPVDGIEFKSTVDHSKWAVSSSTSGKSWVCVGDINRAQHQEVRGGGTVCIQDKKLTVHFQELIDSIEECTVMDNDIIPPSVVHV